MEHRVLRSLDPEHQEAVLASAHRRRYARGEVVFHEGDRGDTLHLLVMGRVAVQTTTRMGEVVTVNVLGAGASFGELALVDRASRRVATIVALEPVETLRLTRSAFDELRRTEPSVNQFLVEVLAEQVTALNERLREAYFDPVEPRVCRCLARLAEIYESGDGCVTVPLKQETIASMVGATRPSVNRVLRELEAGAVLSLSRGKLELLDTEALGRLSR
jgi:CRP-like cAMP-binding protein